MNLLGDIIGGLASGLGGLISGNKANAADAAAAQQAATQNQIVQYMLNRRQNIYDPMIDKLILPVMASRITNGPGYAGMAAANEKRLTSPFALNY